MAGTRSASPCFEAPEVGGPGETRRDAETALAETLAWLAEATHSAVEPVNLESAWQRVEARVAGEAPAGVAESGPHRRHRAVLGLAPVFRLRLGARRVAVVLAACALGLLAWSYLSLPRRPPTTLREVRVNPSLWQTDTLAEAPAGDAIDELTGVLKP